MKLKNKIKLTSLQHPEKSLCIDCGGIQNRKDGDNFYKYSYECSKCKKVIYSDNDDYGWWIKMNGLDKDGATIIRCDGDDVKYTRVLIKENDSYYLGIIDK